MNYLRCPELDRLGRELIEAYRRAEDRDVFCLDMDTDRPSEVTTLHCVMGEHRRTCPLCQEVTRHLATTGRAGRAEAHHLI